MTNGINNGMPCEWKSPHMRPNIAQHVTFASRRTILPYIMLSRENQLASYLAKHIGGVSILFFRLEQQPLKMSVHGPAIQSF